MSSKIAYLNGEFMPLDSCQVSVLDRGFIFGDGVYELIPVYKGNPFQLSAHLLRLTNSCHAIGIDNPHTDEEWQQIVKGLIEHSKTNDLSIYLQVTRGIAPREHYFEMDWQATIFAMAQPLIQPSEKFLTEGVSAITAQDIRWHRCDIKTISLVANVMLRKQATEANSQEAILLRGDLVTEGSASNVFLVNDNKNTFKLLTAPKNQWILPGITRDIVIDIARKQDITVEEREIKLAELSQACEIWLTSSVKDVLAVTRLDGKAVGGRETWQALGMYEAMDEINVINYGYQGGLSRIIIGIPLRISD